MKDCRCRCVRMCRNSQTSDLRGVGGVGEFESVWVWDGAAIRNRTGMLHFLSMSLDNSS